MGRLVDLGERVVEEQKPRAAGADPGVVGRSGGEERQVRHDPLLALRQPQAGVKGEGVPGLASSTTWTANRYQRR